MGVSYFGGGATEVGIVGLPLAGLALWCTRVLRLQVLSQELVNFDGGNFCACLPGHHL